MFHFISVSSSLLPQNWHHWLQYTNLHPIGPVSACWHQSQQRWVICSCASLDCFWQNIYSCTLTESMGLIEILDRNRIWWKSSCIVVCFSGLVWQRGIMCCDVIMDFRLSSVMEHILEHWWRHKYLLNTLMVAEGALLSCGTTPYLPVFSGHDYIYTMPIK